mmetsp:Transcript_75411/g.196609  ORF Transcript_75411/g.196609 Transcript_75411/m.196609 type:complete len:215 (-) Transcript_75411:1424-2068(-)
MARPPPAAPAEGVRRPRAPRGGDGRVCGGGDHCRARGGRPGGVCAAVPPGLRGVPELLLAPGAVGERHAGPWCAGGGPRGRLRGLLRPARGDAPGLRGQDGLGPGRPQAAGQGVRVHLPPGVLGREGEVRARRPSGHVGHASDAGGVRRRAGRVHPGGHGADLRGPRPRFRAVPARPAAWHPRERVPGLRREHDWLRGGRGGRRDRDPDRRRVH